MSEQRFVVPATYDFGDGTLQKGVLVTVWNGEGSTNNKCYFVNTNNMGELDELKDAGTFMNLLMEVQDANALVQEFYGKKGFDVSFLGDTMEILITKKDDAILD